MNRIEMAKQIALRTGRPRAEVLQIMEAFEEITIEELKNGGIVKLHGFGVFGTHQTSERTSRNPRTGEVLRAYPKRLPEFKFGISRVQEVSGAEEEK